MLSLTVERRAYAAAAAQRHSVMRWKIIGGRRRRVAPPVRSIVVIRPMAADLPVLDYGPPARPKWLLRTLVIVLIIAAGAGVGAAIGDRIQPDLYIFNGTVALPSSEGTNLAVAKQAHIRAIRGDIPTAAAALKISPADHMPLKDVPGTQLISVRCTSRSSDTPLAMVNALIVPYCNNIPGMEPMPGTLDRTIPDPFAFPLCLPFAFLTPLPSFALPDR